MGLFGRKKKDLVFDGVTGTATIRGATRAERFHNVDGPDEPMLADLGIGTLKYQLELDVQLADGRPAYPLSGRYKVPLDVGELDAGMTLPVRADPGDPAHVELDWDAWRASPEHQVRRSFDADELALIHKAFPEESRRTMVDGWVQGVEMGTLSREQFDESIKGAIESGMLNETEAAAATARIEQRS